MLCIQVIKIFAYLTLWVYVWKAVSVMGLRLFQAANCLRLLILFYLICFQPLSTTLSFDELLVGAPLYTENATEPETGRVYLYRNLGVSSTSRWWIWVAPDMQWTCSIIDKSLVNYWTVMSLHVWYHSNSSLASLSSYTLLFTCIHTHAYERGGTSSID